MDSPNFRSLDYINELFPTEQSLSGIDDVIAKLKLEYSLIDENIHNIVCGKANVQLDENIGFKETLKIINTLQTQIIKLWSNAEKTEEIVKEITAEIQRMDFAKKNLISAITTLNHLSIFVQGIDELTKLIDKSTYRDILNPLEAVLEVSQNFQKYINIPEINTLSKKVYQIKNLLGQQIIQKFKESFSYQDPKPSKLAGSQFLSLSQLSDACKIISILDSNIKEDLLKWVVQQQLSEYQRLFSYNQDIARLERIDERFDWFKCHLLSFEQKCLSIFPLNWKVSEKTAIEFCHLTKNDISLKMSERSSEINVRLLMFAIKKTKTFEQLLSAKFTDQGISKFQNSIGDCFRPHLYIFINSMDHNLAELLEHFVEVSREPQKSLLPSSGELFIFFKKCMVQCSQFSNDQLMYDLAELFKKYLALYGRKVLEPIIYKRTHVQNSIESSMSNLTKDIQNISIAAGKVIFNFLSDDAHQRFTETELRHMCCILTTAEYCLETIPQLQNKLEEKIARAYVNKIDMSEEKELFHGIISNCIQLMVQDLETTCEYYLTAMNKVQWQNISNVGDQSSYISALIANFKETIPIIRDNLSTSLKYFTQFCHKFAGLFIQKFINNLYKCRFTKPDGLINILGCEQLLLDTYTLKTSLLDLPLIGSKVEQKLPMSCSKIVLKDMSRAEMIIKVIMTPIQPSDVFVAQVLKLIPDITSVEYQNILDMKSVKRFHQTQLIEIFKQQNFDKKIKQFNASIKNI